MKDLNRQLEEVSGAIESWLQPDNARLKKAVDRTVDEGLFAFHDVKHRIRHLKASLNRNSLVEWVQRTGLTDYFPVRKKILALHAGNLPLVGLQDALAVILSGGTYMGKLSRKDPYLMSSLLDQMAERGILDKESYTTEITDFSGRSADAILFAGSAQTVPQVESVLVENRICDARVPRLMRTAHYSVAFIEDSDPQTMRDLTEAVFRYGGNGCRSAAYVVAPFGLHSQKCHFTDYVEEFWLGNPQHSKPGAILYHQYAANKALGIEQAWLDHFLVEERFDPYPTAYTLQWIPGGERELGNILSRLSGGLQSVYTQSGTLPQEISRQFPGLECEKLSDAQTPPLWWKPDGIDTIEWICKKLGE